MVYRNVPKINLLFRHSPNLLAVFDNDQYVAFDEWGFYGQKPTNFYEYSMTAIINAQMGTLGIRWYGGFRIFWNGECTSSDTRLCGECIWSERSDQRFWRNLQWQDSRSLQSKLLVVPYPDVAPKKFQRYEALLCHFEYGKTSLNRMSLEKMNELLNASSFSVRHHEGVNVYKF